MTAFLSFTVKNVSYVQAAVDYIELPLIKAIDGCAKWFMV